MFEIAINTKKESRKNKRSPLTPERTLKKRIAETMDSSAPSPSPGKVDRDAMALNLLLENCLMITLRAEAAYDGVLYMGDATGRAGELLNSNSVNELVCARLSEGSEILNAVNYLIGCYKKLYAKENAAPNAKVQAELARYESRLMFLHFLFR